jgi:hypothetical protein
MKIGDFKVQNALLAYDNKAMALEIKRLEAELITKNKDDKIEEYVQKLLRLGKADSALRYSSKLMCSLTAAKEKARLEKELEY